MTANYLINVLLDKIAQDEKEKEQMQEPKRYNPLNLEFGNIYCIISNNEAIKTYKLIGSNAYKGRNGIYFFGHILSPDIEIVDDLDNDEIKELMKDKKFMLYSDYLAQQERKAKFKYPDLVVGKKYNCSDLDYNPYEFLGYEDNYTFKNNKGKIISFLDGFAGEITEYVEPEIKLEPGKKYVLDLLWGKKILTFMKYDIDSGCYCFSSESQFLFSQKDLERISIEERNNGCI